MGHGDGSHLVLTTGIDGGVVLGLQAPQELTSVGEQRGVAVQPDRRRLHRAVELERTVPHVGSTRMLLHHIGQHECALALLHQVGSTAKGTARERGRIINNGTRGLFGRRGCGLLSTGALHPGGCVHGENPGRSAIGHADGLVLVARDEQMLVSGLDGAVHFRAAFEHHGRRLLGDTFQFAKEEAGMRSLVVAHRLPRHGVTILMVGPERGHGPRTLVAADVDAQGIARTYYNLLAPVADDVAEEARIVLRRVVQVALAHPATVIGIGAATRTHLGLSTIFIYAGRTLYTRRVHELIEQVAVPVHAHVPVVIVGHVVIVLNDLVGH